MRGGRKERQRSRTHSGMGVGGGSGCRVRAEDQERLPGRERRRRTSEAAASASCAAAAAGAAAAAEWAFKGESEARSERASARGRGKEEKGAGGDVNGGGGAEGGGGGGGGGGRGKGPAGAALGSAVAAPAVWRRTGAAGAPPAGARSHPRRASSRGTSGLTRRAPGGSADPASPPLRSVCGAGWPAGRRGLGPPPQRPPRLLPLAVEPRRPPVTLGALEPEPSRARAAAAARRSQASSQRAGRGVGAAGRRDEGGRGARSGMGAEDRTLSREGSCTSFLPTGKNTPKLRTNFSRKLEASDEDLMTGDLGRGNLPKRGLKLHKPLQDQGEWMFRTSR
ncbi:uncharacterized protein RBU33_029576 [Hipposideros larvatus]